MKKNKLDYAVELPCEANDFITTIMFFHWEERKVIQRKRILLEKEEMKLLKDYFKSTNA